MNQIILTYEDIVHIRKALAHESQYLESMLEQHNQGAMDSPLTDDELSDIGDDILFYDKLLYWFSQWEKQFSSLRHVNDMDEDNGR